MGYPHLLNQEVTGTPSNAANQTNKAVCVCATMLVHPINQTASLCGQALFEQAAKQHTLARTGAGQAQPG